MIKRDYFVFYKVYRAGNTDKPERSSLHIRVKRLMPDSKRDMRLIQAKLEEEENVLYGDTLLIESLSRL